jgi:MFS family permease
MSAADAGYLAALPGISAIAGSVAMTRVAARLGQKRAVTACLVGVGLSLVAVDRASGPALVVALAMQGFFAGGVTPILLTILMDMREVGAEAMGVATGAYFAVGEVGGFAGPALMGLLKDLSGGFTAGLMVLAAIALVMLVPIRLLRDPRP